MAMRQELSCTRAARLMARMVRLTFGSRAASRKACCAGVGRKVIGHWSLVIGRVEDTTEGEPSRESYGQEQGKDGELAHRASTSIMARVSSPEVSALGGGAVHEPPLREIARVSSPPEADKPRGFG